MNGVNIVKIKLFSSHGIFEMSSRISQRLTISYVKTVNGKVVLGIEGGKDELAFEKDVFDALLKEFGYTTPSELKHLYRTTEFGGTKFSRSPLRLIEEEDEK